MKSKPALRDTFLLAVGGSLLAVSSASAQSDLFWDANGASDGTGGTGNWGTTNTWRSGSDTGSLGNWADANDAHFSGTAGTVTITSGTVTAHSLVFNTVGYTIAGSGASNTLTINGAAGTNGFFVNQNATVSAVLAGSNGIRVNGTGMLTLTGNNTVTSTVIVSGGSTLSVGANNNLGLVNGTGGGWISLNSSTLRATGSFIMNAGNNTSDANYVRRVQINGNSTIQVTGTNNLGIGSTGSYTGTTALYGSGTLNKTGTGTLTLRTPSTANSFSGNTNVNEGTLNLQTQGALANSPTITVAGGAILNVSSVSGGWSLGSTQTLAGAGTITGSATIIGTVAPGTGAGVDKIGDLTTQNNITWNGGTGNPWDFDLGTGNTSDTLAITGNFNKGTGTGWSFDFMNSAVNGVFNLVTWTGSTTFASTDFSFTNLGSGRTGTFLITGNTLQFTAIPEPGSAIAGLLLAAGLLRRRRNANA